MDEKELFEKNMLAAWRSCKEGQADAAAQFYGHCFNIIIDSLQSGGNHAPGHSDGIKGEVVERIKSQRDELQSISFLSSSTAFDNSNKLKGSIDSLEWVLSLLQNSSKDSNDVDNQEAFEAFRSAWSNYPSQDNEGHLPDRGGFKAGWFAALDWVKSNHPQ